MHARVVSRSISGVEGPALANLSQGVQTGRSMVDIGQGS